LSPADARTHEGRRPCWENSARESPRWRCLATTITGSSILAWPPPRAWRIIWRSGWPWPEFPFCETKSERFAGADRRQVEGVHSNCERLSQGRFAERHPVWDGKKIGGRQVDQFTEKTGEVRAAQKAKARAHIVVPAQAELAVIAIKRGLKRPAGAHGESGDTGASLHDSPRGLVPEHHRVDIGSAADRALGVGMQIGSADAHGFDPDLDFARSGIFNRHVGKPECQGGDKFRGSHRMLSLSNNTSSAAGNKRRADGCPSGPLQVCWPDAIVTVDRCRRRQLANPLCQLQRALTRYNCLNARRCHIE